MISAWDCFHFATLELVRSTPIKQRLICAYRRYLATVVEDQIPSEVRGAFSQVMRSLRGVKPLRGEDAVAASVRKMSMQEADECAALIVEIFGLISRAHSELSIAAKATVVQLHNLESTDADFVPALLARN